MEHFYDGQIRRYITQTIRVFSNFVVKYGDGTLHQIPVMYGDIDRQVASIVRNNSENKISTVPRIAVYVKELKLDRNRLADATYVGKVNIRERDVVGEQYTTGQGRNYTVERIMPTPFELQIKIDIWASNTDQKLQILEQILVLFNPSLEIQTNDNYIDWTSLTVLNLNDINWSSRTVPVGTDNPIDVATITVETPIWLSPPVKIKQLGIIKKIITSFYEGASTDGTYIEGLGKGMDPAGAPGIDFGSLLTQKITTISDFGIQVYNGQALILAPHESVVPAEPSLDISVKQGVLHNWQELFDQYPGQYTAGSTRLYLIQPTGSEISGTVAVNPLDNTILTINWNLDTLVSNTGIDSNGYLDTDVHYNAATSNRPNSPGTFDAIVNPQTYTPGVVTAGTRYLLVEDMGDAASIADGKYSSTWGTLVAKANDIIEYNGTAWRVIFISSQENGTMIWQTNLYTGVQYLWNGVSWVKSFEGEYRAGQWRLEL